MATEGMPIVALHRAKAIADTVELTCAAQLFLAMRIVGLAGCDKSLPRHDDGECLRLKRAVCGSCWRVDHAGKVPEGADVPAEFGQAVNLTGQDVFEARGQLPERSMSKPPRE